MILARIIRDIARQGPVIETATVTSVGTGGTAKVARAGQTTSTKSLPIAAGLSLSEGDVVELVKLNGNINTAYISRKIR